MLLVYVLLAYLMLLVYILLVFFALTGIAITSTMCLFPIFVCGLLTHGLLLLPQCVCFHSLSVGY